MNVIKIQYAYFHAEVQIEINGEPLDILNDSLNGLRKEFYLYATSFYKILDNYFKNPYVVDFCGTLYQIRCLEALKDESKYCHNLVCSEIESPISESELLSELSVLQNKYGIHIPNDFIVSVRSTEDTEIKDGDICLCTPNAIPEHISENLLVCLSDKYAIYRAGMHYIVELPEEEKDLFLQYYKFTVKVNPYLCSIIKKLNSIKISHEDSLLIKALRSGIPQFILDDVPSSIDVGDQCTIVFKTFPQSSKNTFQLTVSNPAVISIDGQQLTALDGGTCEVCVVDSSGSIRDRKIVTTKKHEFIHSIRLVPSFQYLKVNESGRIDAYILPEDAEDALDLKWSSSNTDIAQVSKEGRVVAFKTGSCIISVSSKNICESYKVIVKEEATAVSLSKTSISLEQEQTCQIQCNVLPDGAAIDDIQWELSNEVIGSINVSQDKRSCVFTPHVGKSGNCSVRCSVNSGKLDANCNINILPPPNHDALYTCTIIFTVIGCLALGWLTIALGWIGYFLSLFLPTLLSLIGLPSNSKKYGFKSLFAINVIATIVFAFLHIVCCG